MHSMGDGTTSVRILGAGSPLTIRLRPVPEPGSRDPLRGQEVWHTVTDATVLAGPRSPAGAVRLLDQLRCPSLAWMRQRLAAAARETPTDHITTATMVGTLLQWPHRARTTLVHDVACSVEGFFASGPTTDRPEVSRTLGWVLALTLAYPGDPLALTPILLRARRLPADSSFILPAGCPFLRLTGAAVGIGTGPDDPLEVTLGTSHGDISGLISALERQPARTFLPSLPSARPGTKGNAPCCALDGALQRAFDLARQLCAIHPQLAEPRETIDLRRRRPERGIQRRPERGVQARVTASALGPPHGPPRAVGRQPD